MLLTLIVVEDISPLVDLKPGESPLHVMIYHSDQGRWADGDDLEEFGVRITQEPKGDYDIPSFAYTDVGGPPRIVHAGNLRHYDTKPIVMAVYA